MQTGALTSYFDVAQITLYAFWLFFAGLIIYLRREDKREGYPLISDRSEREDVEGFPPMPMPKVFLLPHGETRAAPRHEPAGSFAIEASAAWPGSPFVPTGNPMLDAVGPASYANRADVPDLCYDDGKPKIVPLRAAADFFLAWEDPDPRGMAVVGDDGVVAGSVVDVWVDRSETCIRYLEVALAEPVGTRHVLLPMNFTDIKAKRKQIWVSAILGEQFATVPALRNPDQVTLLEEDKITGYYGGGFLYATPARAEPLL
jgi:photosynthetic reaction center H subunit